VVNRDMKPDTIPRASSDAKHCKEWIFITEICIKCSHSGILTKQFQPTLMKLW
jgi:hypothetical protein